MAKDTAKRRVALRDRLVEIAESHMRDGGLAALRARPIAAEAGCAVGAIYNVFDDMNGLALAVNGLTFQRLGAFVTTRTEVREAASSIDKLVAIAIAYLDFAAENPRLWRSLFEIEASMQSDIPEWYLEELRALFTIISGPLAELHPSADEKHIDLLTRALFSAVHGIVFLGLENRISSVPRAKMKNMIELVVRKTASPS